MNKRFEELVKGMEKLVREGLDLKICFNSLRKNRVDEDDAWKIINNVIHNIISTSFKPKKEEDVMEERVIIDQEVLVGMFFDKMKSKKGYTEREVSKNKKTPDYHTIRQCKITLDDIGIIKIKTITDHNDITTFIFDNKDTIETGKFKSNMCDPDGDWVNLTPKFLEWFSLLLSK